MKYLCNQCGNEFTSQEKPLKRSCPYCNSEGNQHIPQPFGTSTDSERADLEE
jgi:predicted  nucleic acid-binding Zn-ribbon protein